MSDESEYRKFCTELMDDAEAGIPELQVAFLSSIALSLAKIVDLMKAKTLDFDALAPRD